VCDFGAQRVLLWFQPVVGVHQKLRSAPSDNFVHCSDRLEVEVPAKGHVSTMRIVEAADKAIRQVRAKKVESEKELEKQ